MATEFDLASFFGGGGDSEIEKLLTPKQREQLSMQATLAAAAQLLQAGGRSSQRAHNVLALAKHLVQPCRPAKVLMKKALLVLFKIWY
jgi:hypothetical protein